MKRDCSSYILYFSRTIQQLNQLNLLSVEAKTKPKQTPESSLGVHVCALTEVKPAKLQSRGVLFFQSSCQFVEKYV